MITNTLHKKREDASSRVGLSYSLPSGKRLSLRLLADPTDMADNAWFGYREVDAWNGLVGGITMPGGLRQFPLIDGKDPCYERVALSADDIEKGNKRASVSQRVITTVVYEGGDISKNEAYMPVPSTPILLKMARRWYEAIQSKIEEKRIELGDDWSPVGPTKLWLVKVSGSFGSGYSIELAVKEDAPPMDLPGLLDAQAYLVSWRRKTEEFVLSQDRFMDVTRQDPSEELADRLIAQQDEQPSGAGPDVIGDDSSEWDDLSSKNLRDALDRGNVAYSPRATRSELIELAKRHL